MSETGQEPVAVDQILSVRPGPRPDPLPRGAGDIWATQLAWATALVLVAAAALVLRTESLGLVACGAAVFAVASAAVRRQVLGSCQAIHFSVGLLVLMMTHGAETAGVFALPAGLLVVASLAAGAATRYIRPHVAPLAGTVPWRFRPAYRNHALWYACAGLGAGLALVALAPAPELRVTAIAFLPLGLRSYASNLLSRHSARRLWILGASVHVAALAAFVPAHGAIAAAWSVVGTETLFFLASALVIARRTVVTSFPTLHMAGTAGAALLVCALAIPGSSEWPILVAILFGTACGAILFPRKGL